MRDTIDFHDSRVERPAKSCNVFAAYTKVTSYGEVIPFCFANCPYSKRHDAFNVYDSDNVPRTQFTETETKYILWAHLDDFTAALMSEGEQDA